MATKTSGASPNKRRKYDDGFKTEALRPYSKALNQLQQFDLLLVQPWEGMARD